ncbi:MAG TPA: hypothetical protein HPP65_06340, partial [Gammaproteobacteria bacterium]|nr:hypothetical protein [Gammaproteobacteria bacterium]
MTSVLSMEEAAQQLGVMLAPEQQQKLEQYLDLLMKWNKVYNLTAIRGHQK